MKTKLLLFLIIVSSNLFSQTTWYSYQSGNWAVGAGNWRIWTLDPSGTTLVNPSSALPLATDHVVILNGRIVTIPIGEAAKNVASVTIQEGAVLDITTTTGHNFGSQLNGSGLLRLSIATFPAFAAGTFVQPGGGTVEYTKMAGFAVSQNTYNNLIINLNNSTDEAVFDVNSTLTINGDLTISKGVLRIGRNTGVNGGAARTVNVAGNTLIENGASMVVGTKTFRHQLYFKGNLINNGTALFTRMAGPIYSNDANSGYSDVYFTNDHADQNLVCNGTTIFYRIVISKGTDQTYILNIDADATNRFSLYGRNDMQDSPPPDSPPNIANDNALGLLSGTVRFGPNIVIPTISNYVYNIDQDAQIWLDGANLTFSLPGNTGSMIIYGKLRISSNATFTANGVQGIILREYSNLIIESGNITTPCLRTSAIVGEHRGAFYMLGGTLNITGNAANNPGLQALKAYASFTIPYPENVFFMSGGTINITGSTTLNNVNPPPAGSGTYFSLLIGSDPKNITLTGGSINITVPTDRPAYFNSTAPLWNLNITSTSNAYNAEIRDYAGYGLPSLPAIPAQPLKVLSDFNIQNSAVFVTHDKDVNVGGNFSVSSGATYTPGMNNTVFDGSGAQLFDIAGTITGELNNLAVENKGILTITNSNAANPVTVNGDFSIADGCSFNDNGRLLRVYGDIINSGTHIRNVSGAGSIQLAGTGDQVISGDGNGSFNNLTLNKSAGSVTLSSSIQVTGNLRLANSAARLNIGSNNLLLGTDADIYSDLTGNSRNFDINHMIRTSGLMSDAGVSKTYQNTNVFLFPVGFYNTSNSTFYYTPYSLRFSQAPVAYGTATVRPVGTIHHFAQSPNALGCYWKVTSTGFLGIPQGSVIHNYTYNDIFVNGSEIPYIPAVYRGASNWTTINNINLVNDGTNTVTYDTAYTANGDYTAGDPAAFSAISVRYSTGINGNWNNTQTWSASFAGGPGGASVPDANTMVIIGDAGHNHNVFITEDGKVCGGLIINEGSSLDLRSFTGHNFEALPDVGVRGRGTLRIAANNYFPAGDFGDFIGENGGTVEYYTISPSPGSIVLPLVSDITGIPMDHYYNLKFSPVAGTSITLPNTDLLIYNDLTKTEAGQSLTSAASQHVTVMNDLLVDNGIFRVQGAGLKQISVMNDMHVNGTFDVANNANASNSLELYHNLSGTGTFTLYNNPGRMAAYFRGADNATVTGSLKNFYSVEVDKGSSRIPVLDVSAPVTTNFDPQLTLKNGTFRLSSGTFNVTASAPFTIPSTACLSANGGTLNVLTADVDTSLYLIGRLEVLSGTVNVGNSSNTGRSDIEYSAGGNPEIFIQTGGTLNVKGQIKRNSKTTLGSLKYTQYGGDVHIFGKNQYADRAKLEICNDSSSFTFTGGTINFYADGGTTFGDLYLKPDNYDVSGGTIVLAPVTGLGTRVYDIDASCNLHNLTVPGNTGTTATARIMVEPLSLTGNLLINTNGTFDCNNRNLSIAGNFTNNGTFTTGNNITIFNGGNAQTATFGVATTFNKLLINKTPGSTVVFTGGAFHPAVNDTLFIAGGTLQNAGTLNIVTLGNIINNSTHASTGTGNLVLQGTKPQVVSGNNNGRFGNVSVNNATGITFTADAAIDRQLSFTSGNLNINDFQLTFSETALSPTGTALNQCIISNGVLSDGGIRKDFPAGASSFNFGIGVAGKYTPVNYTITANAAPGYILLKPVNARIPATYEIPPAANELQYYWNVTSGGFSGLTANARFTYMAGDIRGTESNATYVGAAYRNLVWTTYGHVDEINHRFTINGLNNTTLSGEYTCGETVNFTNISVLYTAASGNWNSDIWTVADDGTVDAGIRPNNNPLVIKAPHSVVVSNDDRTAYSVNILGVLNLGVTTGHNLGHVYGSGRLIMSNTNAGQFVFPGGDYADFMNTTGSTVEYNGVSSITPSSISPIIRTYQNLEFTGDFPKYLSCMNITVRGNMLITGSQLMNNVYHKNISLLSNWTDQVTNGFVPGRGLVSFDGSVAQTLVNTAGAEHFYNLRINNASGLTINSDAEVSNRLFLTDGHIHTTATNVLTITNPLTTAVQGGDEASFVDGPLQKNILAGQFFNFPVGNYNTASDKPLRSGNIYLSNTSGNGLWTATYKNTDPDPLYSRSNLLSPITSVSNNEYWVVNRPGANTANIRLRWDEYSDIVSVNSTRVTEWVTNRWEEKGAVVNGTMSAGTVSTSTPVTTNDYVFTLGVSGVTARITNVTPSEICNNGEVVTVTVLLTGAPSWTLTYSAGGNTYTQSGIATSTFDIQLNGTDLGGSGFKNIHLVSVSDMTNPGIVDGTVENVTVKSAFIPDIQGTFTVGAGEIRTFNTASNAGSSWLWSWNGTSGGTFSPNNAASTDITMAAAGNYSLQVRETSSNGCQASDVQPITIINTPSPDISPSDPNVCDNESVRYSTPLVTDHTYAWTVDGGTFTGSGNSIDVIWTTPGNGYVAVRETYSGLNGYDTVKVVIDPEPDAGLTIDAPASVCSGETANISVYNSETGVTYQLRDGVADVNGPVAGNGGTITLSTDNMTSLTIFNILAYNNGCSVQLGNTAEIDVISIPAQPPAITGSATVCQGSNQTYSVTAVSGATSYTWTLPSGWSGTSTTNSITATAGSSGTISVTADNDCGSGTASTLEVTVSTVPAQPSTITGNNNPCQNTTGLTYSVTNVAGVTYTWTVPAGWSITAGQNTNSITVTSGSSAGNITVTPSNTCGNGTARSLAVTTNSVPAQPSTITGNNNPCQNTTGLNYSVTNVAGVTYTWTVPAGWSITAGQNTSSITVTSGSATGNITVTPSNTCGNGTAQTLAVTTNTVPAQPSTITGNNNPCQNTTGLTYSVTNVAGVTYTWTVPAGWSVTAGQNTSSITVTSGSSAGNITVTPSNTCGNGTAQTLAVTTNTVPAQPSTITGNNNPCQNTTGLNYSVTNVAGVTYTWTVPAGWSVTAGQNTSSITVTSGSLAGNITVTPSNTCGNGTARTLAVTTNTVPAQPSSIAGNNNPCQNTTGLNYSVTNVAGVTYTWTVPAGWSITTGQNTSAITVTSGSAAGNITITPSNTCGNGTAQTLAVTTNTVPAQPSTITGNNNPCQNTTGLNYSVTNVAGVTYTWTVPAGWSITAGQNTNSITVTSGSLAGNITVTPSNTCGNGTAQTLAVTTNTVPAQPSTITGNNNPCQNTTGLNYSVTNVAGVTYTWTVPAGWSITAGQNTNSITVTSGSSAGNITVTPSNTCGNGTARSLAVTTNSVPAQPSTITGNNNPCQNTTGLNYSVTNVAGVTYTWTVPAGWSITAGQNTNSITVTSGSSAGNITVTPSNTCGNGTARSLAVTTNSVPAQPSTITGNNNPCQNTTGLNYSVTNVAGVTYTWTVPAGWSITAGQNTSSITVTSGSVAGNITVTPSNTCGNGTAQSLAVTINSVTAPEVSATQPTCSVDKGSIELTGLPAGSWTINPGAITGSTGTHTISGLAAGTYSYTVTNSQGCESPVSESVEINTQPSTPTAPITGTITQPTCSVTTGSIQLTGLPSGAWTVFPVGITGNTTETLISDLAAGTYSFTVENSSGCTSEASAEVVLTAASGCSIEALFSADDNIICVGGTVEFSNESTGTGAGATFEWSFGEGAVPETATGEGPFTVEYPTAGNKTVRLIVTDGLSDTLELTDYISVRDLPDLTLSATDRCGSGSIDFLAETTAGLVDFSLNGVTTVASDNLAPFTYIIGAVEGDSVQVWARAVDSKSGCSGEWDSLVAHAMIIPVAEEIFNTKTRVFPGYLDVSCAGGTSMYNIFGDENATYNWRIPELGLEFSDTTEITVVWDADPGTYKVEIEKISANGCASEVRDTLVLISQPDVDLGDDVQFCEGGSFIFEVDNEYSDVLWHDGSSDLEFTASVAGNVSVTVTDQYGCTASDTAIVVVYPAIMPVELGNDTILCGDETLVLNAGDYADYEWSTGENTPTITVHAGAGDISVTVTDVNGCKASDEITVDECTPVNLLVIPNTFTPDGNGAHDEWVIRNIEMFPQADIQVFDRWGRLVFHGSAGDRWDGRGPNGKELPVENYYYIIDLKSGGDDVLTGTISIVK